MSGQRAKHGEHGSDEPCDERYAYFKQALLVVAPCACDRTREDHRQWSTNGDELMLRADQDPNSWRCDDAAADSESARQQARSEAYTEGCEQMTDRNDSPCGVCDPAGYAGGTTGKRPVMAVRSTRRSPVKRDLSATSSQRDSIMMGHRLWNSK